MSSEPSRRRRSVLRRALLVTALGVLAIPFVVPTVWMVAASLKPLPEIFKAPPSLWTSDPSLSAYSEAFGFQPFRQYVNSVYIAVLVTAMAGPCVLATFVMRQFFIALLAELEEAGRLDGLGRPALWWRVFLRWPGPRCSRSRF